MDNTQTHRISSQVYLGLLLGVGACVAAVLVAGQSVWLAIAFLLGLSFLLVIVHCCTYENLVYLTLIFLALGIPFNLDLNLFLTRYVGVASVDIGVTFLSALLLYVLFFYHYATSSDRKADLFKYNRTLFWAPIFYMLCGVLSFFNAASAGLVVLELVRLAMLFLIFFIVMNLQNKQQISVFVFALSVGLILQAFIAFYQNKTGHFIGLDVFGERSLVLLDVESSVNRTGGTIGHPNMFAYYLEMLIPLMLGMFLGEEKSWRKAWYLIALIFGMIAILLTQSRGGWITVPVSLALVLFVMSRGRLMQLKSLIVGFVMTIVVVIGIFAMYPTIERRLTSTDYGSAESRIPLDKAAFSIVKQYPVLGVGLNNFNMIFQTYDQSGGSRLGRGGLTVHNMFLGIWTEVGTVGLIAFLWMCITAIIIPFRWLFNLPRWHRGVAIGVSAGLIAQMIHAMVDPGFRLLMSTSMLFYCMMGLTGAIMVLHRANGNPATKNT